jgi:hypothetical protein
LGVVAVRQRAAELTVAMAPRAAPLSAPGPSHKAPRAARMPTPRRTVKSRLNRDATRMSLQRLRAVLNRAATVCHICKGSLLKYDGIRLTESSVK